MSNGGWGTTRQRAVATCHPSARHYAKGLCQECYRKQPVFKALRQRYYQANREQWKRHNEVTRLLRKKQVKLYGISREEQEAILAKQGGVCAICGDLPGQKSLGIDHDHVTGRVRGMLCSRCNTAIGGLKDSPELCEQAAAYLRHHTLRAKTTAA